MGKKHDSGELNVIENSMRNIQNIKIYHKNTRK